METIKEFKNYGHQGDLNFRKIDKLPDNLEEIKFDDERGGYTLALGEHTNHAHTLVSDKQTKVRVIKDEHGRHYLDISGGNATLLHGTFLSPTKINENEVDKHIGIIFTPGIYQQDVEEEYSLFEKMLKKVQD